MTQSNRVLILILIVFLITRIYRLTALPVFADEAIYIRWAQLISQEPLRYVSLPILDGKPPLYMLLLTAFLPLNPLDPLAASRMLNVIIGVLTVWCLYHATKNLTKSVQIAVISAAIYTVIPFSFFFNRMGLIDPLVSLGLSIFIFGISLHDKKTVTKSFAIALGIAICLWAKTSSLLLVPSYIWLIWSTQKYLQQKLKRSFALAIGIATFGLLSLSPAFPSLFTRSQDFSFSISQIIAGQIDHIPGNIVKIAKWLGMYMTWPSLIVLVYAGVSKKYQSITTKLLIASFLFVLPFILIGKVVASRYIFPITSFLIPVIAIGLVKGWQRSKVVTAGIVVVAAIQSSYFMFKTLSNPASAPLAHEDHVQYLSEWSAGFGIPEVRDFIKEKAKNGRVVVATEGYFGTLPDGLLMYFIEAPELENLEIFGIGQPIEALPEELLKKAKITKTYLVINQHRLRLPLEGAELQLINSYPKPEGPPLLLLEVVPEDF